MLELLAGRDAVERKLNQSLAAEAPARRRARRTRGWAPTIRPFAFVLDLGIRSRKDRHGGEPCRACSEAAGR